MIVRRSTMASFEIHTIACCHFVRRTGVFYTRTIACAAACGSAVACGEGLRDKKFSGSCRARNLEYFEKKLFKKHLKWQ